MLKLLSSDNEFSVNGMMDLYKPIAMIIIKSLSQYNHVLLLPF